MTDSQEHRSSAQAEATQGLEHPPARSTKAVAIRWTLAALLLFIAGPYLWLRMVTVFVLLDFVAVDAPYGLDRPGLGAFALLVVTVSALMYRLYAGRPTPLQWPAVVALFLVWIGISAAQAFGPTSDLMALSERSLFVTAFVLSSLWIPWFWIMPKTKLSAPGRWAVLVLLLSCVVWPRVLFDYGFDGGGNLAAEWRFAAEPPSVAERVAAPEPPAATEPVTEPETPSDTERASAPDTAPAADMAPPPPAAVAPAPIEIEELPSFPQFLGPNRTGVVAGLDLAHDLTTHPPRERWRRPVGVAWGGFSLHGSQAITQEQRDGTEMVVSYNIETGEELWVHADNVTFTHAYGDGPRATPTIDDGYVYTVGATGQLNCLDLTSGKPLWSINILDANQTENRLYGQSGSPLIVDELVIVSPGGGDGQSLIAYQKDTGKEVWRSGIAFGGYGSPTLMTIAGTRQVVMSHQEAIAGYDPATGSILWTHPWPPDEPGADRQVRQPIQVGDGENRVMVTSAHGSRLIEVSKAGDTFVAKQLWESRGLKAKFSSAVIRGNYAYGLDMGILVCLDLTDGTRKWKAGRYGHGQLLLADDLLIIQVEAGGVAFVEANPEVHSELFRMEVMSSKTWNAPAVAGQFLLLRNDLEAVGLDLSQQR